MRSVDAGATHAGIEGLFTAMKTLPKTFEKPAGGAMAYRIQYRQLHRQDMVAVYERKSPEWTDYETVVVGKQKAGSMHVKKDGEEKLVRFEAKESYPPSTAWGTDGFTFQTEDGAIDKMGQLLARIAAEKPPVSGKQS